LILSGEWDSIELSFKQWYIEDNELCNYNCLCVLVPIVGMFLIDEVTREFALSKCKYYFIAQLEECA